MMRTFFIAMAAIGVLIASCKSKKEMNNLKVRNDSIASMKASAAKDSAMFAANGGTRLNVSFYSPGNGINHAAVKMLDSFWDEYKSPTPGGVALYINYWGKEGEVDYCFITNGLNKQHADSLVSTIKDLLKDQDRINYSEFTTCNKRR